MAGLPRKPFYFLRHGQTDHNVKRLLAGRETDVPLNHHGRDQARFIAKHLQLLPIQTICCSPLKRAKETMELGATGLARVERMAIDDLKECLADVWPTMVKQGTEAPFCDQVQAFFTQVLTGMQKALTFADPVLIIAHGGVHWALCHQLKISNHDWRIGNAEVAHFFPCEEGGWKAQLIISPCSPPPHS